MSSEPPPKPTQLAAAEVANAGDLVSYEVGSITTRTLVKTPTVDVTILAFDEGRELKAHTVAVDALVQVLEGEVDITIAGKPHHLQRGDMILMPALQPHALKAVTRFKMILTRMKPATNA